MVATDATECQIKIDSAWFIVQRANRKTVRVQPNKWYPLGGTIPWYKVEAHRRPGSEQTEHHTK